MPWNSISTDDVLQEFTPAETALLNNIQGSLTNLGSILSRAVNSARGSIIAGGNTLDPVDSASIPDQLRAEVIAIARWKWLISLPQLKTLQTDARRQAAKDAEDLLQLIASQKPDRPRVENPDGSSPITAPAVKPRHRHMKLKEQDGL